MNNTNYKKSSEEFNQIQDNNEIDIKDIWQGILRKRKWFILTSGIVFSGSIIFTINSRIFDPVYQGNFSLLIMDPMSPKSLSGNPYSSSTLFQKFAGDANEYEINTLITLLRSPIFLEPIAKKFNISPNSLRSKIKINQATNANRRTKGILNVYLEYENKKEGQKILDEISKTYLKASSEQNQKKLNDGLNFLNSQAPNILNKKNELEGKLVKFREKYKFIEPLQESGNIKMQQNELEKKIILLREERNKLMDIRREIENGTISARGFKKEMNDGLAISDFDQGLLQELINIENEIASAKLKYTPNSGVIKGLNQRLNTIRPLLLKNQLEAVDTALLLNKGSISSTTTFKSQLEEKFLKQPELIREYQEIDQQLQLANENLLSLVSARENFQLEIAQNNISWRIISPPRMGGKPVKPDVKKNLFYGIMASILAGSIIALIRDRLDHVFHNGDEVSKAFEIPILVNLPFVDAFKLIRKEQLSVLEIINTNIYEQKDDEINSYQRFFYQEAFRNLYTSIRFLDTSQELKTIVLTSSIPQEGKSLTNILLAKTLSEQGLKVLLIDADLRRPQIHSRLDLNNLIGLSNILINPKIKLDQIINKVDGFENWSVITGGTIPPDPTRILGSERFKEVISELKDRGEYDMILIDSPPILGLADSLLISEQADGVILLIGLGIVDRALPKESLRKIKSTRANLYGLVTNQTKEGEILGSQNSAYSNYGTYANYGKTKEINKKLEKEEINLSTKSDSSKISILKIKINSFVLLLNKKINKLIKWLEN